MQIQLGFVFSHGGTKDCEGLQRAAGTIEGTTAVFGGHRELQGPQRATGNHCALLYGKGWPWTL
jgi:hypothetical protein